MRYGLWSENLSTHRYTIMVLPHFRLRGTLWKFYLG